jgi:hypothetical protein
MIELPNITIKQINNNESSWSHLLDSFQSQYNCRLSYSELIILGDYCNNLQYLIYDWRKIEHDELICLCLVNIKNKLEQIRKNKN